MDWTQILPFLTAVAFVVGEGTRADWQELIGWGFSLVLGLVLLFKGVIKDYFGATESTYSKLKQKLADQTAECDKLEDAYQTALIEMDTRRKIAEVDKHTISQLEQSNESLRNRLRLATSGDGHKTEQ